MNNINKIIQEEINYMFESIHVYHGTDRKFDDFDMNKIGSGDGNSIGGWGIYFSDSDAVSKRYYLKKGFIKEYDLRDGSYFDLDASAETDGYKIINSLEKLNIDQDEIDELQTDYLNNYDVTNKQVYDWLTYVLGGEKQASLFLKSIGYLGNTIMDKWETDARNYIIFDTNAIISN